MLVVETCIEILPWYSGSYPRETPRVREHSVRDTARNEIKMETAVWREDC